MRATKTSALPTQITFHGLRPSAGLSDEIRDHIAWLEQFCPPMMGCRVRLQVPHRHQSHGRHMHVTIQLTVPGRPPVVVKHEPSIDDARVAIREAFDRARRRLRLLAAVLVLAVMPSLGYAQAAEQAGFFPEPDIIGRTIRSGSKWLGGDDGGAIKSGFYADIGGMITGAGWISGGPGYRRWLFDDRLLVDGSAQISWRMYKLVQGRAELPKLANGSVTVGVEGRWQDLTQVDYYGIGPDSPETNRSEYAIKYANAAAFVTGTPTSWLALKGRIAWITEPSIGPPGGTFDRGFADTAVVFPDDPVFRLAKQPQYLVVSALAIADTRDHRGYPTRGGLYQAAWSRYTDRPIDAFTFQRYEFEAARFVPLASGRIILVGHGWLAGTRAEPGRLIPFYLQPSLGGTNTLRSYADYRFHDRNLIVVNAETRLRLFTHIDWAAFAEAGNVAPKIGELNLDHRSFGIGVRVHTDRTTIARLDFAHGGEGWRISFRMNDPFRFSRLTKRISPIPFSP